MSESEFKGYEQQHNENDNIIVSNDAGVTCSKRADPVNRSVHEHQRQIYVSTFIRCVSKGSRAENVSGSC